MAKRVRASRSAHRPGGQGPNRTKKTSEAETEADVVAAEDIGADYAEVEVDEVAAAAVAATATETPEPEAAPVSKRSRRRARRRTSKKSADDLASRSAAEDVWVREDLRRIGIVSVILITALAVAWVVFGVMDILNLY